MNVKVEAYVGTHSHPIEERIELPMDEKELTRKIKSIFEGKECLVFDFISETPLPFSATTYQSIFELNRVMQILNDYFNQGQYNLIWSALAFCDGNVDSSIRLLNSGNYEYYFGVKNEEEVGEAIVESGQFGALLTSECKNSMAPEKLMEVEKIITYLNYEKIGEDFVGNGGRIFVESESAIRALGSW